ncbi:hypothetical protein [Acinetobacter venetianus]|uniref:hypothetical protein n=1 Tax=Acinetobacter venetianus TaxID=52133 RepID=UPI0007786592|nr:hypothetical protein [Acinetobacter venetianus]KXZ66806.1 hypothetical protein AVENLUH7437_00620 [Acinetobacter venetianus]
MSERIEVDTVIKTIEIISIGTQGPVGAQGPAGLPDPTQIEALQAQIDALSSSKLDAVDYVQHFRGYFTSFINLTNAVPIGIAGDYAHVDLGITFGVSRAAWDVSDNQWFINEVNVGANTDEVPEGATNLYFKSDRVRETILSGLNTNDSSEVTSSDSIEDAVGKLQSQYNNLNSSSVIWLNLLSLPNVVAHSFVDLSTTKIEIAKINGLLYVRGYFRLTNQLGSSGISLITISNSDWLAEDTSPNFSKRLTNVIARNGSSVDFILEAWQADNIGFLSKSTFQANTYYDVSPTCLGKAKN